MPLTAGVVVAAALLTMPVHRVRVRALLPFCVPVLATLSTAWSAYQVSTISSALLFLVVTVSAWNVARVLEPLDIMHAFAFALRILLLASLGLALVRPDLGLVSEAYESGALRGVFNHRNLMAYVALVALITAVATRRSRRASWHFWFDVGLAMLCMVAARSQSILVAFVVAAVASVAVHAVGRIRYIGARAVALAGSLVLAVLLCTVAVDLLPLIVRGLGRDLTFTGRTVIWDAVLHVAGRQPVLGTGWNAAWVPRSSVANEMWNAMGFVVYQGHNGYLEFYLQLGIIGLTVLVVVLLGAFLVVGYVALTEMPRPGPAPIWLLQIVVLLAVTNLSESRFIVPFGWLLFVVAYYTAGRLLRDREHLTSA